MDKIDDGTWKTLDPQEQLRLFKMKEEKCVRAFKAREAVILGRQKQRAENARTPAGTVLENAPVPGNGNVEKQDGAATQEEERDLDEEIDKLEKERKTLAEIRKMVESLEMHQERMRKKEEELLRIREETRKLEEETNRREEETNRKMRPYTDQTLDNYLASIHRVTYHMQRLLPVGQTPRITNGRGSWVTMTPDRPDIVGMFYPHKLRVWSDFASTCGAAFARMTAVLGSQQLFLSPRGVDNLSEYLVHEFPSDFIPFGHFLSEDKTSYFLRWTLEGAASNILNAYLQAVGQSDVLYFDSSTRTWRSQPRQPEKNTQPGRPVPCADAHAKTVPLKADGANADADADPGLYPRDDVVTEPAKPRDRVRCVASADHKAVHRLRAAAVERKIHVIDEDCVVKLAQLARSAVKRRPEESEAGNLPDDGSVAPIQEAAVQRAGRGGSGKVDFVRTLVQAFHNMVSAGVECGYVASGETLTLLRVPRDDPTTLYYHSALFPMYTKHKVTDTAVPPSVASAEAPADSSQFAVSMLAGLCLLAYEAQPESVRQKSIRLSKMTRFPDVPIPVPIPETISRKRKRQTGDDANARNCSDSDDDDDDDDDDDHGDQERRPKKRRVGHHHQYDNIVRPTLPSPRDPATFRPIRPYCTQTCLLGLMRDGDLDPACPNVLLHRRALQRDGTDLRMRPTTHHAITAAELPELVRLQLRANAEQDCHCFLWQGIKGDTGCLFKITLTGYGYTFSAKGVDACYSDRLHHEMGVYAALSALQGRTVPVFLGLAELLLPWPMANGGIVTHMLFMSYVGRSLDRLSDRAKQIVRSLVNLKHEMRRTARELRAAGGRELDMHIDRNVTWCHELRRVVKIDFEHVTVQPPPAVEDADTVAVPASARPSAITEDDIGLHMRRRLLDDRVSFVESLLLC